MKKLVLLMLLMPMMVLAQSGLYFNPDRNGEGITLTTDGDLYVTYFFTYGGYQCDTIREPTVSPSLPPEEPCDLNGQRWFFGADLYKKDKDLVEGTFYMTTGVDYPEGALSNDNPFGVDVGQAIPVGNYALRARGEGYQLRVFQLDENAVLPDDDYLFEVIFDFNTLLFGAGTGD